MTPPGNPVGMGTRRGRARHAAGYYLWYMRTALRSRS